MSETTAAVLTEIGAPLSLMTLLLPELRPGQVLVEIAYSGLCHSQLNEILGKRGPDRYIPHTLGHEGSGIVRAVGDGVAKVQPGQRVVLTWIKGTGADVPGSVYGSAIGPVNSGAISTFQSHAIISENRLVPLPDAMALREAALLGCAIPTGAGIVFNTLNLAPGQSVAIFGVGGIGLAALLAARAAGASPLIAVDVVTEKLALAERLGATHTIDGRSGDVVARIRELTGGRGVDGAVEAAGVPEAMEAAYLSVRTGGGQCVIAGNVAQGRRLSLDPYDLIVGRRIAGSWGGDTAPDRDIPHYVDLYRSGRLALDALVSAEYPLHRINDGFAELQSGRLARALLHINPQLT